MRNLVKMQLKNKELKCVLTILNRKLTTNLERNSSNAERNETINELENKIYELKKMFYSNKGLKYIMNNKLDSICPVCKGTGWVTNYKKQMEFTADITICVACNGTGKN